MNISEKVAYIKGLAEGLNVNDKVVNAILDVLADIAKELSSVQEDVDTLGDYIEEIDEDLGMLEEEFYGEDDCDCCDCDDDDCDCCDCDDDFVEVECPGCGDTICIDEDTDLDHVECPNCGAEFTCICDCCDEDDDEECSCCHHDD